MDCFAQTILRTIIPHYRIEFTPNVIKRTKLKVHPMTLFVWFIVLFANSIEIMSYLVSHIFGKFLWQIARLEIFLHAGTILPAHLFARFPILDAHNHCSDFLATHLKRREVKYFRLFTKISESHPRKKFQKVTPQTPTINSSNCPRGKQTFQSGGSAQLISVQYEFILTFILTYFYTSYHSAKLSNTS